MTQFIKLTEIHKEKGKTFFSFLQVDSNEGELKKLKDLLYTFRDSPFISGLKLSDISIEEKEVNVLVKYTDGLSKKLTGVFASPQSISDRDLGNALKNQGIANCFTGYADLVIEKPSKVVSNIFEYKDLQFAEDRLFHFNVEDVFYYTYKKEYLLRRLNTYSFKKGEFPERLIPLRKELEALPENSMVAMRGLGWANGY